MLSGASSGTAMTCRSGSLDAQRLHMAVGQLAERHSAHLEMNPSHTEQVIAIASRRIGLLDIAATG